MKQKLTKSLVESLAPAAKDVVVWDTELPGFGVRVKPAGVRSYVVQYRDRQTGESRRKTIGQHGPLLTLHKAREQARILLAEALNGRGPVRAERAARAAPSVVALAEQYLAQHAVPKKRPRSAKSERALLERLVLPRLGSKKVAGVQAREIHALHVAMSDTPYQANRLLALLSKMFALAVLASSLVVEIRDGRRRAAATATSLAEARRRVAGEVAIGSLG